MELMLFEGRLKWVVGRPDRGSRTRVSGYHVVLHMRGKSGETIHISGTRISVLAPSVGGTCHFAFSYRVEGSITESSSFQRPRITSSVGGS